MRTKVVCETCRIAYILFYLSTTVDKLRCRCGGKLVYYRDISHGGYTLQSVNASELEPKPRVFECRRQMDLFEDFRQAAIERVATSLALIKSARYDHPDCYDLLEAALARIYIAHNSIITAMVYYDEMHPDRASKRQATQLKEKGGD